jgi:hypothetical protein
VGVAQTTRHFETANDLRQEIIDVRVWSGIHYRDSDEVGAVMGRKLAQWALNRRRAADAFNLLPIWHPP